MKPCHAVALALGLVSDGAAVAFAAPHPPPGSLYGSIRGFRPISFYRPSWRATTPSA
jgi:hypothetical protein